MAPEIAMRHLETVSLDAVVLDPMVGSGTTLKIACMKGCRGIGFDVDPMALLIARVWNTPVETQQVIHIATDLIQKAYDMLEVPILNWIDNDKETIDFIHFWFAEKQQSDLKKLSYLISMFEYPESDVLRVALSRIIITKNRGASLGRDISHSRPHKVALENDFEVFPEFYKSVLQVCKALESSPGTGLVTIKAGNAKHMDSVPDRSIDYIMTSPPYLTAVDYFRGHRLALVWLGYSLPALRALRSHSIGLDRHPDAPNSETLLLDLYRGVQNLENLKPQMQKVLSRYAVDLYDISREFHRVLKSGGKATVVFGDCYY